MSDSKLYLKEWLSHRGLKQVDLVDALDVRPGQISDLANGRQQYSKKWLDLIAPILEVNAADLLAKPDGSAASDDPERTEAAKTIGLNIKKYRKARGWTQEALAKKLGKALSTVKQMENGERLKSWPTVSEVAKGLGVTPNELFGYEQVSLSDARFLGQALAGLFDEIGIDPAGAEDYARALIVAVEAMRAGSGDDLPESGFREAGQIAARRSDLTTLS